MSRLESEDGSEFKTVEVVISLDGTQAELRIPRAVPTSTPDREWTAATDLLREVATILLADIVPR